MRPADEAGAGPDRAGDGRVKSVAGERLVIDRGLDEGRAGLSPAPELARRREAVYQHVYAAYAREGRSIYGVESPGGGEYRYR